MTLRTKERRSCRRVPASHRLTLSDRRGRHLARGRTANISARGVYAVVRGGRALRLGEVARARLVLPAAARRSAPRRGARTVRYRSRVVRLEDLGKMTRLALELLDKLS